MSGHAPRAGLEGVDVGDGGDRRVRARITRILRSLALLATDPQAWSARRYRASDRMWYAAVRPAAWRKR